MDESSESSEIRTDTTESSTPPNLTEHPLIAVLNEFLGPILGPLLSAVREAKLKEWHERHKRTLASAQLDPEVEAKAVNLINDLKDKARHEMILEGIAVRMMGLLFLGALIAGPLILGDIYGISISTLNDSGQLVEACIIVLGTFVTSVLILYLPAVLEDQPECMPHLFSPDEDVSYTLSGTNWWIGIWFFISIILAARIVWLQPPGRTLSEVPPSLFILFGLSIVIGYAATAAVTAISVAMWWRIKMDRWRSQLTDSVVLSPLILALEVAQGNWRALLRSRWPPSTRETVGMRPRRPRPAPMPRSAFAGFRFPPDVIVLAVRWYLRFGLSYRDVEELLTERGVEVDHVTVYRWVLRFTPLLADAAKPCRHTVGDRWYVDETYVKVAGRWRYVYRAIDQFGQVIDVFVSARRDADAAHRFFERAIGTTKVAPVEVVTDRAPTYPQVLDELLPAAWHRTDRYANNRVEADHGRLKARLRPMRGLKQDRSARVIAAGHAFVQNVRRGHYELAVDEPATRRLAVALAGLALAI
jgi:transposase-like protein